MTTIEELLKALRNPQKTEGKLENTPENWRRVRNRNKTGDKFEELGMEPSALESYLEEFLKNDPYNN